MDEQQLSQLSVVCEQAVVQGSSGALAQINEFFATDVLSKCELVLRSDGSGEYGHVVAATVLHDYLLEHDAILSIDIKIGIRGFLLSFLSSHPTATIAQPYIVKCYCLITRIGWFEIAAGQLQPAFQNVLGDLEPLLGTEQYHSLGLQILTDLVVSVSQPLTGFQRHKKVLFDFRDVALLGIFTAALEELSQFTHRPFVPESDTELCLLLLGLVKACLSYDFNGTALDDAAEDEHVAHLPNSWNAIIAQPALVNMFFGLYSGYPHQVTIAAMSCISLLVSCRSSLFSTADERMAFLGRVLDGIRHILFHQEELANVEIYQQFCRMLFLLKRNHQLADIAAVEAYPDVIEMTCKLTVASFQDWKWSSNSVFHLLSLWHRLVGSMNFARRPHKLEEYVPQIADAYIDVHLKNEFLISQNADEHPLDSMENLVEELDMFAALGRFDYDRTRRLLEQHLISVIASYSGLVNSFQHAAVGQIGQEALNVINGAVASAMPPRFPPRKTAANVKGAGFKLSGSAGASASNGAGGMSQNGLARGRISPFDVPFCTTTFAVESMGADFQQQLYLDETRIVWLVMMIGALIGGRPKITKVTESTDGHNGDLACLVFRVLQMAHNRTSLDTTGADRLECAFLFFFRNVRKVYLTMELAASQSASALVAIPPTVGSSTPRLNEFFERTKQHLSLASVESLLDVILNNIIFNIRRWPDSDDVIQRTMELFKEMALAINTNVVCSRIEAVQYLVNSSLGAAFEFLQPIEAKFRQTFFEALIRLAMLNTGGYDDVRLERFLLHFDQLFDDVINKLQTAGALQQEELRHQVVCLARDLTGVVSAFSKKSHFMLLFEWIQPVYLSVFSAALEDSDDPQLIVPILKLFVELCTNTGQRIVFDTTSPGGVHLFREMSRVLSLCARKFVGVNASNIDSSYLFEYKYKSCIHCFALIRNALAANFVNLGVMTLYHDDSVETALVSFLQLMSSIPTTDLVSIPKLTKNFFSALDYFLQDLTSYLFVMPVTLYISVLGCVEEGLKHIDRDVRDLCCRIVENITGYVHRHMSREKPSTDRSQIEQLLAQAPQALPHVLELILNMIFYDTDRGCHMLWRPLLGLILLFEKEYVQIRDLLIESSPPARVHIARAAFEKLMADIEPDLTLRTKDRFNANLQHMRAALRQGVSVRDATAFGTTIVSSPLEGLGMFDGGTMQAQQHVHLLHNAEYGTNAQASPRFYQGAGATTMS